MLLVIFYIDKYIVVLMFSDGGSLLGESRGSGASIDYGEMSGGYRTDFLPRSPKRGNEVIREIIYCY